MVVLNCFRTRITIVSHSGGVFCGGGGLRQVVYCGTEVRWRVREMGEIHRFKCGRRGRKTHNFPKFRRERRRRRNSRASPIVCGCGMGERILEYGEAEGHCAVIWRWFRSQGIAEAGASRAVRLLNAEVLLTEPRPGRWNRRGEFGVEERCRYLWYRHAAKILGWCERQHFPNEIRDILRTKCFPPPSVGNEEVGQDGTGIDSIGDSGRGWTGELFPVCVLEGLGF